MRDDETRHLTPEEIARDQRAAAGLCIRWDCGPDACIKPYGHLGVCEDAQGNTTLTLKAGILGQ